MPSPRRRRRPTTGMTCRRSVTCTPSSTTSRTSRPNPAPSSDTSSTSISPPSRGPHRLSSCSRPKSARASSRIPGRSGASSTIRPRRRRRRISTCSSLDPRQRSRSLKVGSLHRSWASTTLTHPIAAQQPEPKSKETIETSDEESEGAFFHACFVPLLKLDQTVPSQRRKASRHTPTSIYFSPSPV